MNENNKKSMCSWKYDNAPDNNQRFWGIFETEDGKAHIKQMRFFGLLPSIKVGYLGDLPVWNEIKNLKKLIAWRKIMPDEWYLYTLDENFPWIPAEKENPKKYPLPKNEWKIVKKETCLSADTTPGATFYLLFNEDKGNELLCQIYQSIEDPSGDPGPSLGYKPFSYGWTHYMQIKC